MAWGILLLLVVFGLMGLLGWLRWREGRYLKKSAGQTMSAELKKELEKERQDALRRKKTFEETLKKFGK